MISKWMNTMREMGPAWIISAVACGPGTLASVAIAGSTYGYAMLWVVVLSAVFGTTAQYLAAKIGVLEGRGIIAVTERRMGRVWAWVLTVDALAATWLAAVVLMNALSGITGLAVDYPTPWWGVFYGVAIGLFLVVKGYRWFETLCKVLVGIVVVCFGITLFLADLSAPEIASGLIPRLTGGVDGALAMAAIMGGAVHITIIGMHTYTTNARGWTREHLALARLDTVLSMGLAFGAYSVAIFLVAAAVLHPNHVAVKVATDAALALRPLLGDAAMKIFLLGLWAAAFSTISPTFLAGAYFLADKMGWGLDVKDRRFAATVLAGCLLSMAGPFVKGSFILLLPLMLAMGLVGTPLIIGIILYLLHRPDLKSLARNTPALNVMASLTLLITSFLAIRFVAGKLGIM